MRCSKSWVGMSWVISACWNVQTTITVPGVNSCLKRSHSDFAEEAGRRKGKQSQDRNLFSCKWSRSVSKGALSPAKAFTWVFGAYVSLCCRISFSAQWILGSGGKSVQLLSFVSSFLFRSLKIAKAEIVESLNNMNCVFCFNLSTKFLFQGKQLHNAYFPWPWFWGGTDYLIYLSGNCRPLLLNEIWPKAWQNQKIISSWQELLIPR